MFKQNTAADLLCEDEAKEMFLSANATRVFGLGG
jgi:hypothetical protein